MAEVQPRQLVQRVAVQSGFLRVGDQHGVVERGGGGKPARVHHHHVGLGVVIDFQYGRVGQQRPERSPCIGQRHLVRDGPDGASGT